MFLKVNNLSYTYPKGSKVLDSLSFRIRSNETLAVVGASGCGKSTLLRLISGIIKPNNAANEISINGLAPHEYVASGKLGFMFQDPTLFPNLTVRDNIALPLKIKNIKNDNVLESVIEKIGLTEHTNSLPNVLSGGMKTRTALARTFVVKPELILLDEPFSSLDIKWKHFLYQELELLKQQFTTTVVIVTHDIYEALLLSNHIIVLGNNGKVLDEIYVQAKLPRVFELNSIASLQTEFSHIQNLILNN
jgi:NitT/TauT family transport system ATP-binding protein